MPEELKTANTQDLADGEYDAERWARVGAERQTVPSASSKMPPGLADIHEVDSSQKGTDEDAIAKRKTNV